MNSNTPLVSVILPTFNRSGYYLERAIQSVVNQSYDNWELIIIDNHSTDNTLNYINSLANKNISIYMINNNGNIAKSRNYGISHSNGNLIAFLDSDDFWEKNKLEISISFFQDNKKYAGVCHSENWTNNAETIIKHYGPEYNFKYETLLQRGNCISLSAMVLKKKYLEQVNYFSQDPEFITAEDYDLWLNVSKIGGKIGFIKNILGTFQMHSKSESSDIFRNTKAVINVLKKHINKKDKNLYSNACSNCWINAGKNFYINHQYNNAIIAYKNAIKFKTFNFKVYIYFIMLLIPYKIIKIFR
tara:strand:+ start:272 stop:1174 length:903 start_codon:yes stop_codon:yes gene_type:complete